MPKKKEKNLTRTERNYAAKPKVRPKKPIVGKTIAAPTPTPPPITPPPVAVPEIIPSQPPSVPAKVNADLSRYYRFIAGETESEIAAKDGIDVKLATNSIQRGEQLESHRQKSILTRLRFDAAVTNENLRNKVRQRLEGTFVDALEKLLIGEKCVVERDKEGRVTLHRYTDPDILSKGIEQYRKTTTMEEKASNIQPLVFNLNQQNNLKAPDPEETPQQANARFNFEDRLARIRKAQRETGQVIDQPLEGEITDVDTDLDEPSPEQQPAEAQEESQWNF